jgi:hypothetical protein
MGTVSNQTNTSVRKAYNEPQLVEYGALTDLTRSGSPSKTVNENRNSMTGLCGTGTMRKPC